MVELQIAATVSPKSSLAVEVGGVVVKSEGKDVAQMLRGLPKARVRHLPRIWLTAYIDK